MDTSSRVTLTGALLVLLGVAPTCKESPREQYERRVQELDKPAQHAIHDERLRAVMAELTELTYTALPQGLDVDNHRQRRVQELRAIAREMSAAAGYIPSVLRNVELRDDQAEEFRQIAARLQEQTQQLEKRVADLSVDELNREYVEILNTCNACHEKFRVLPLIEPAPAPKL